MKKTLLALSVMTGLFSATANAELRINGFASITAGMTLDDDDTLYGYDSDISLKPESLFALQVSADLQEKLSATAQIIARGEDDFDAEFEWAYITYELSDSSQVSAGKMRIPFYRYSDYLDVGYAYRWIRPPQSVYNLSFSTYEGISYLHNSMIGDWDSSLQLVFGSVDDDIAAVSSSDAAELNNTLGFNWTMTKDWFSARAAYFISEATIDLSNSAELTGLISGLNGYGLMAQADDIAIDEDDAYFAAIGFSIDYENVLVDAEYTEFDVDDSILAKQQQYYVSLGYRLDEWTINLTYEDNEDDNDSDEFNTVPLTVDTQLGTIPVTTNPMDPNAPYLRDLTNLAMMSQSVSSNSYSLGARYNFHPSAAFKIDLTQVDYDTSDTKAEVLSLGVDIVF